MTDFSEMPVRELEMSVRAQNVLKGMGVSTLGELLKLSKGQVMSQQNAGIRTWREIRDVQAYMSPVAKPGEAEVAELVRKLNVLLHDSEDFTLAIRDGRLMLFRVVVGG